MDSILNSIKKMLGLDPDYTPFDTDITVLINGALMVLRQLGVGETDLQIADSTATWQDFIGSRTDLEAVKTYVYLKTKLSFDPPASSTVLKAYEDLCKELEWRLNVQVDPNRLGLGQ